MVFVLINILAPVKLTNVSGNQTVREGSNAILFCEAAGRPQPNIILTRVLEDGSSGEVLQQGPTIAWDFLNISRTASGTYMYHCTADNGFSRDWKVFQVNVTCKYITQATSLSERRLIEVLQCVLNGKINS